MIRTFENNNTRSGSRGLSDAEVLDKAEVLVEKFLMFLRANAVGRDVFDTNALPASKTTLINAFRLVIATEPRWTYREQLLKAGMTLAHFQDDVGPRMSLLPSDTDSPLTEHELEELAQSHHDYIRKFDAAFAKLEFDKLTLMTAFQRSLSIAERREQNIHSGRPFSQADMHQPRHA